MSGGLADNIVDFAGSGGSLLLGKVVDDKTRDFIGDPLDLFGRKAEKERAEARRIEERRTALEQRRAAIEAVRQAQIARADVAALGETVGLAGSSSLLGSLGSIQSQAGGNLVFQQQQNELRNLAAARIQQATDKMQQARNIQFFGQMAIQAYNAANTPMADRIQRREGVSTIAEADTAMIETSHQDSFSRTV